jgi:hypothetical protein
MCFTTQDFAGAGSDVAANDRDLALPRRVHQWVSYLTTQVVR